MKYIKDSLDYIEIVSFNTDIEYEGKTCTLYTGKVPDNYNSLEEWSENALINAYKIINGDLVLDEARKKYLENKFAKEEEENTLATHKYVNDKLNLENNLVSDELATEKSGADFITLENTKDYNIPKINVDSTEDKEVVVTNKNLLSNDLINAGYRGVRLETNEDKSFKLDGKISDYASENFNSQEIVSLKADIEVEGKAEQRQLEGYNLISTDIALWEEGHYAIDGTPTPYVGRIRLKELFKVKPNSKYFFKVITDKMLNIQADFSFVIRAFDKDKKFVSSWGGGIIDVVKDIPQNVEYLGIALYSANDDPKWTLRWYDTQFKNGNIKIMICESDISKLYEEYCGGIPSPNLDYPQEIKTVDKIGVNISSLNLFDGVPIASLKPTTYQHIIKEVIYDEQLQKNVLHITSDREYPTLNYDLPKRLEKGKYYCLKFKYKFIMHNTVNVPEREKIWFFPNERNNNWDNYSLVLSKNATTPIAEEWTDRVIKFEVDNASYNRNEYSYTKILLSLGFGRYAQGEGGVDITWLKKEVFISDLMLYEISENDYNDTNYTSLDYKQYFLPIAKENILPVSETATSLPNGIKDEIRENKFIKRIIKRELNGTEYWNPIWNNLTNTMGFIIWSLNIKGWNVADINEKQICLHCNSIKAVARGNGIAEKDEEAICLGGTPVYLALRINKNRLATQDVAGLKKYLADRKASGNPVVIYYELKTPVETNLDIINVPSADAKIEVTTNLATVTNSRGMEHIESIELPFKSDRDNLKMLYLLKAGKDYTLSGLNDITLNMYSYNGTDRELVYSGTGGKINVATDKVITHTSLTLKYANKFNNTVIKPQLELGAVATEYIEGKQIHSKSTLKEFKNIFRTYDGTTHIMNNKKANMKVKYFLYQTLKNTLASFKVEQDKIIGQVKESIDFTRNLKGKELEVVNALDTTIEELKISRNENAKLLLPSTKLYPSAHLFPCTNTDSFTICVDTAPSTKPTANIKKYNIATKIYMLVKGTVKDEVIIKTNADRTTCTVELVQKLQNINGVISELTEPKITKLADLPIMCLKGTNYIYIEPNSNYNNYSLDLTYIYNTELNKLFTNKTEVSSKIEQTKNAINLEVSKKVGKDEIKSAINQSAEKIKIQANNIEFEGTVTANENFKILEDGSIEAKNGSFSGNINLADGSEILGGRGLLTNLQFFGKGDSYNNDVDGFAYVGFQTQEMESKNVKTGLAFNFYIPENFTIEKATMHLTYVPLKVNNTDLGSIKNVKLYKQNVDGNSYFAVYLNSSIINNISSYSEDTKLLSGDFNKQGEHTFEITQSINYGVNRLVIQSGNEPPAFNEMDWDGNHRNTAINSGYLSGEIYIIGYLNNSKKQGGETYYEKNSI